MSTADPISHEALKPSRRDVLRSAAACGLLGLTHGWSSWPGLNSILGYGGNGKAPNLIFILADDMGFGDAGFNGQQKIQTPAIDRMAKDGAVFSAFYAGAPVCGPSRACLMTGQHTGHCKQRANPGWIQGTYPAFTATDRMLPKELKKAGYVNGMFGKWGLNERGGTGHPLKQGFDVFWGFDTHQEAHYHWPDHVWHDTTKVDLGGKANWREKRTYADDLFADKAIDFIDEHAGRQPFFLYLASTIPHMGISVPEDSQLPYRKSNWPKRTMKSGHYRHDPEGNVSYAGMISRLDSYVQRIRDKVAEKGVENDTLIIFTSDNGHEYDRNFFNSNGPFTGMKRWLHEGGIRMPTVAVWPGTVKAGSRISAPLAFWDVLPTFCELAGKPFDGQSDGISFVPALLGKNQPEHDFLYWEFNEKAGPMQAIRKGNWKAIRQWDKQARALGPIALFDLSQDTGEKTDVARSHPDLIDDFTRLFKDARTPMPQYPLKLLARKRAPHK